MRPLTWLVLIPVALWVVPMVLGALASGAHALWARTLNAVLPVLVSLGFLSIFIALLGGERGSKLVGSFWFALLKLLVSLIEALAKGIGKLFKKKMPKWFKEMVEHDQ